MDAAALAAVLAVAVLARLPCLRTEPWFDELWSLRFARRAGSVAGVLFGIHHDNNHPLNTLWLYFFSGSRDWALLRLPEFVCGVLTVAVLAADREDRAAGLLAAALAAVSGAMVLFSTEARGYALMAFCAAACFRLLSAPLPLTPRRGAAFALLATLGFFGHASFVFVFAALAAWAAARLPRAGRARALAPLFGPAVAACVLFLALQDGRMQLGLGPYAPFWPTAAAAAGHWAGAPGMGAGPAAVAGALLLAGLCAWELARLRKARDPEFLFHALVIAGVAASVAAVPFRTERYFFAALPFVLLLAARSLTRLFRGGPARRAAAAVLLLLFVAGNAARVRALAVLGRGKYREAVLRMAADTEGPVITVGGDQDQRASVLLDYFAADLPPSVRLEYIPGARRRTTAPEWFVIGNSAVDPAVAPIALTYEGGPRYRFVAAYPYAGQSGWSWFLYRRERTAAARPPT